MCRLCTVRLRRTFHRGCTSLTISRFFFLLDRVDDKDQFITTKSGNKISRQCVLVGKEKIALPLGKVRVLSLASNAHTALYSPLSRPRLCCAVTLVSSPSASIACLAKALSYGVRISDSKGKHFLPRLDAPHQWFDRAAVWCSFLSRLATTASSSATVSFKRRA